jgi:hypothetical protein
MSKTGNKIHCSKVTTMNFGQGGVGDYIPHGVLQSRIAPAL